MKKPPIPIIITMILLNAGYLCCSYALVREINAVQMLVLLFFLTVFMIGINMAVLNRHAKFILLLGTAFLLFTGVSALSNDLSFNAGAVTALSFFMLIGIIFIIWSILLFRDNKQSDDICIKCGNKHKYWLYSAIVFCAVGMFFGILGKHCYENGLYKYYGMLYLIMVCILFTGILQFLIYYILRKRKELQKNRVDSQETEDNLNP